MRKQQTSQSPQGDKTGLNIILTIVVFLFMIGLIVFIFALFSGQMQDSTSSSTTGNFVNESIVFTNGTGSPTSVSGIGGVQLSNVEVVVCN